MSLNNQSAIESNNTFMVKIEDLIKEILVQNSMPYYRVESRMELIEATPENSYRPVIRIITYFEDTVSKISDILQAEFDLENVNAINKKELRIDTFSYKHIQYLAGLKASRQALTEYKRSSDKKFEVQVCSMLQDAWVGIEKELGYESASIPDEVKRDFYRVGALLEMADIEFLKIRSQLAKKDFTNGSAQPAPAAVKPPVTTFAEHLQAVVNEAQAQPIPAPVAVAPAVQAVVAPVVVQAAPEPVAVVQTAPVAPAPEQAKIELESMDMNANSFNSLAMNVNNIVEKNGITDDSLSNIININPNAETPLAITPEEQRKDAPPVAEITPEGPVAQNGDGVALNIDNVQTFNMNVSGMIEKTTEIIREHGAPATPERIIPFYEEQPKSTAPVPVDENAQMTDATLKDYVLNSKILKEVDMQIAERAGAKLNPEVDIEGDVDRLRFLKVFSLKQLHERITDNAADIAAFAEKWIGKDNGGSFDSGICLFYLEYLLVGKKNDPAFAIEYVVKFISDNDYSARYIIPTYNSIRNAETATTHAHLTLK